MKPLRVQRHPWIDADLARQLKIYCAAKGVTETAVFNAAVRDYFADSTDATLIMSRLDRNKRALDVVQQTTELLSQTFVAFLDLYLSGTPAVPEAQRTASRQSVRRRLDALLEAAATGYANGERLLALLPQDEPQAAPASSSP